VFPIPPAQSGNKDGLLGEFLGMKASVNSEKALVASNRYWLRCPGVEVS